MVNPFAYFDCLAIASRLLGVLPNVSEVELSVFAYLSCLLSLYRGRSVAAWSYKFAITERLYPYSVEIAQATDSLVSSGKFLFEDQYLTLTESGYRELRRFGLFSQNSERIPFIAGACSSIYALPVGIVRDAISNDPQIKGAIALDQSRLLLEDPGLQLLYDQFNALSTAVGVNVDDLMVPAVVWLSFLSRLSIR